MENTSNQNEWFAELHTQHLKKEEVVAQEVTTQTVEEQVEDKPDHVIEHIVTEEDIKENPEFIAEGISVGDEIKIEIQPTKIPAKRGRKKKVK